MKKFTIGERYYMWKYITIEAESMDDAIKKFTNGDYKDDDIEWGPEEPREGIIISNPNDDSEADIFPIEEMEDTYVISRWPYSQFLMEQEGFKENCHLINDGGFELDGGSYFVRVGWLYTLDKDVVLKALD